MFMWLSVNGKQEQTSSLIYLILILNFRSVRLGLFTIEIFNLTFVQDFEDVILLEVKPGIVRNSCY